MSQNMDKEPSSKMIATATRTKEILQMNQLSLKKSLGQNFLTDSNIIKKIVTSAEIQEGDAVLEIGPGIGALTEHLAEKSACVVAVELDQRLVPVLKGLFSMDKHVFIEHGDILEIDLLHLFKTYFSEFERVHVIANLPYYVTTPIIMRLLEMRLPLTSIVVMVQKEVGERMSAQPGTKAYGSLSAAVQYYCDIKQVLVVPSTVFIPRPNVDSAVIRLSILPQPRVAVEDEAFFFEVIKAAFAQRRKTLVNNLTSKYSYKLSKEQIMEMLESCEIFPQRRGETLTLQEFAKLSSTLHKSL